MKMKKFVIRIQKTWQVIGATDCQYKAYRMACKRGNTLNGRAVIQNASLLERFPKHYFMVLPSGGIVQRYL